jgi:hypothetical protein
MADQDRVEAKIAEVLEQSADRVLFTLKHGRPEVKDQLAKGVVSDALKALARSEDETGAEERKKMQQVVFGIARDMKAGGLSEVPEKGKEPEVDA